MTPMEIKDINTLGVFSEVVMIDGKQAVRLTHLSSGLEIVCSEHRSIADNAKQATQELLNLLTITGGD